MSMEKFLCLLFLFLSGTTAMAQQTVRGQIIDERNNPLKGVVVSVKNTTISTQSDDMGYYSIAVPDSSNILVFSKIEYLKQEHQVNSSTLNITMSIADVFDLTLEELLQIKVVTASRSDIRMEKLPATTYIISQKEIISNNYFTLTDALKNIPEIKVSQPGSAECGNLFLMRGMVGNYYTKVLIDGIPITPSVVSGIAIDEHIYMKRAERIEIVYGPASAVYGADAISGIINIITLKPSKNTLDIETRAGSFGYFNANLLASYSIGKQKNSFDLIAYGQFTNRNDRNIKTGYDTIYDRKQYPLWDKNMMPFVLGNIPNQSASFGLKLSKSNFTVSYDWMYRSEFSSLGQRTDIQFYDDPKARITENTQRIAFQLKALIKDFTLSANLSLLHYRMDNNSYFSTIYSNKNPQTYGYVNRAYKYQASDDILFEEIVTWNPFKKIELVGGITFQFSGAFPKTNDLEKPFNPKHYAPFSTEKPPLDTFYLDFGYNPIVYSNMAGFIQGIYSTDRFTLLCGTRYDVNSEYGSSFNPRIALQANVLEQTSLRASFNRAFKAPSPYYGYQSIASASSLYPGYVNYINVPNKDLGSEKLTSYEVGLRQLLTENVSVEVIGFHNHIFELISIKGGLLAHDFGYEETAHATDKVSIYSNDGGAEATIMGIGTILRIKDIIPSIKLSLDFYANYSKGKETFPSTMVITGDDTTIVNEKIDNRRMLPNWIGKARVYCYPAKNFYVALDNFICSHWYARQVHSLESYENPNNKINGYYTMDVNLHYEVAKFLKVSLKVENIFDRKYAGIQAYDSYNLLYNPQPGRSLYAGLMLTF